MQGTLLLLIMTMAFGAFIGLLFRLTRRPGYQRPYMFPMVGLAAGLTAFLIYWLLLTTTGAPLWLMPVLIVLQVWLWLGPMGPKLKESSDNSNQ